MGDPLTTGVRQELTHEDLDHTPEDGNRYEVIDGELYVSPMPTFAHQRAATRLLTILGSHAQSHALGEAFAAGLKVVLDQPTGVGPDIVFVSAAQMSQMREDGFYGAPDLVVEVVYSKPSLDRVVKFQKYGRSAIPRYWIVDPIGKTIACYALREGRYEPEQQASGYETLSPILFPGLTIRLGDLWVP